MSMSLHAVCIKPEYLVSGSSQAVMWRTDSYKNYKNVVIYTVLFTEYISDTTPVM